jgi:hypothetical protein
MRNILFISSLCFASFTFSQVEIDSAETAKIQSFQTGGLYRSAVSANFAGVAGVIGVSYDYLLSQHWSFEVGGGFPAAGFGFTYYPWKISRSNERFHIAQRNVLFYGNWEPEIKIQYALCFGLTYFGKSRWNWGLDVGPMYEHSTTSFDHIKPANGPVGFMFNFKAGYRFSFKVWKRVREIERGE